MVTKWLRVQVDRLTHSKDENIKSFLYFGGTGKLILVVVIRKSTFVS